MVDYQRRVVDDELDTLLAEVPAVMLDGPKAVGKTETALRRATTVRRLDDPAQRVPVEADPNLVAGDSPTVLLDEWQQVPAVWDAVKRAVDAGAPPGSFLLTGSADQRGATHSGAGRIVTVRQRPMTLAERGVTTPTVSLADLLTGQRPDVHGSSELTLRDYTEEIVASGFPGLRGLSPRALRAQLDGYLERVITKDMPDAGHRVQRPATLRAWLTAYAAATAEPVSYEKIRDAATAGQGNKPARSTVGPYIDVLSTLRIIDPVPGWTPSRNHLKRLTAAPKHHLADPALAVRLLGLDIDGLLHGDTGTTTVPRDGALLGGLFESLATLSVRVAAQANEATVHHLRTHGGNHEIDLLVERGDGHVLAIEIKLASTIDDHDVRHLRWLHHQLGDRLLDRIVLHTGPHAYRRPDGTAIIPLALLGH